MDRRTFLTTALGALALAGCSSGPTAASSSAAAEPATIGLTYIPNIQFSPFYVAADKGFFTAKGVQAKLRHHGANEGLFTALAAGQEQFVVAGGDEMLQARESGLDAVAIASYYRQYPAVVIVRDDSPITKLAQLKGHSVGIPGRYGESWFGLQVALKTAGLTAEDITVSEIGYTQQAALATKKVDALIGFSNNDAVQFELAGVKIRTLSIADAVPLVSICLISTRAYLDAHPAAAKAVADAMIEGIASIKNDPAGAIAISTKQIPGLAEAKAKASAEATLKATTRIMTDPEGRVSGKLDPKQWQDMADFMLKDGLIKKAADPAKAMSNDFVSS